VSLAQPNQADRVGFLNASRAPIMSRGAAGNFWEALKTNGNFCDMTRHGILENALVAGSSPVSRAIFSMAWRRSISRKLRDTHATKKPPEGGRVRICEREIAGSADHRGI
jgi:hypothetical protein